MTQHIELNHENILHDGFLDPIQELLSAATPNFRIKIKNSTTLEIDAGTGNDQISIAIDGKYRYRSTDTTAALPGGLANGEHPVFVTASANDFTGPVKEPDKTVHTFGLEIKKTGETPSTALYRRVGTVTVKSEAIVGFEQTVSSVSGAQVESGALSSAGDIEWERVGIAWVPNLKKDAVGSNEIAKDAVGQDELAKDSVGSDEIVAGAVGAAEVEDGSLTHDEIAPANKDGEAATPSLRTLGIGAKTAAAGNDARLSDTRTPTDGSVTESKLANALLERLGIAANRAGKAIIATEQSRTNAAYGLLTKPDEVPNLILPAGALIAITYSALWKDSATNSAFAAIFLNASQLQIRGSGTAFETQSASHTDATATDWNLLTTSPQGLTSGAGGSLEAMPSTGVVLSQGNVTPEALAGGTLMTLQKGIGGLLLIEGLAEGEYDVTVQFKSTTGGSTVTAKERKLRAWVVQPN